MKKNLIILFIGEGPLFNNCLKLAKEKFEKIYVTTSKKNKNIVKGKNLKFVNIKSLKKFKKIDFIFSIMNKNIIKKEILAKSNNSINFHDSPLPKYAGLYSSSWAILKGEKKHGCTWHFINEGIDEGNIISQKIFNIEKEDTSYSVDLKSLYYGFEMFKNFFNKLIKKQKIKFKKQDLKKRSYFGKKNFLKIPNNSFLDFNSNIEKIKLMYRAYSVAKEKKNFFFSNKILTNKGIIFIKNIEFLKNYKEKFYSASGIISLKNSETVIKINKSFLKFSIYNNSIKKFKLLSAKKFSKVTIKQFLYKIKI